jgi:hypothetical protein
MSSQPTLLGFTTYTVDAIVWTEIRLFYAWRQAGEVLLTNTGDVTVNLRVDPTDSAHEMPLLSGESITANTAGQRGQGAPPAPICYARAASATSTIRVTER